MKPRFQIFCVSSSVLRRAKWKSLMIDEVNLYDSEKFGSPQLVENVVNRGALRDVSPEIGIAEGRGDAREGRRQVLSPGASDSSVL